MNINLFIIFFYAAQMYWKDVRSISIPILWPPDHRLNYNHNVFSNKVNVYVNDNQPSAATTTTTTQYAARNRRNENIYKRPNFDFNRLLFNRFNLRQTSDETFDPVDFNDTDEAPSINNAITSTGAGDYDYDNSETGIIATTTTTTTTTQTPPIIQQTMNNEWQNINNNNNNNNLYNNGQIGWRRKRPCVAIPYTNNIGRQQQEENQYNSKSSERTTFNVYYSDDQHPAGVPVPQNDNLSIYNSYGGYICAPNYGNQHHHNRPSRPPRPTRPQHDDNNHNNNNNNNNNNSNNNNNNNGGFFGGLFDFVNSFGSSTSSPSIVAADSGDGTVTPTSTTTAGIVQNAVQNIQQIDWRPFVGGLANTANDIIQIITNTPTQTVRRRVRPGIHSHHHRPNRRFF